MDTTTTSRPRRSWSIAAAFLALQVLVICVGAHGAVVDEAIFSVAGLRVLEGHGLADAPVASASARPCQVGRGELRRRAHSAVVRLHRQPER